PAPTNTVRSRAKAGDGASASAKGTVFQTPESVQVRPPSDERCTPPDVAAKISVAPSAADAVASAPTVPPGRLANRSQPAELSAVRHGIVEHGSASSRAVIWRSYRTSMEVRLRWSRNSQTPARLFTSTGSGIRPWKLPVLCSRGTDVSRVTS